MSRRTRWCLIGTVAAVLVESVVLCAVPASAAPWEPSERPTIDAPVDLDGNGTSDLVWWDFTGGAVALWTLGAGGVIASGAFPIDTAYRFVGAGDVDRDGADDLVWQRRSGPLDNVVVVWRMRGPEVLTTAAFWPARSDWNAEAVADVDGDGSADIVLTAPETDTSTVTAVWFLEGLDASNATWVEYVGPAIGGPAIGANVGAVVAGTGDFDGDGRASVILTEPYRFLPDWQRFDADRSGLALFTTFDWWEGRYAESGIDGAFGDFDADGITDAYWHHTGTLQPATADVSTIERYVGGTIVSRRSVQWPSARLPLAQVGDYDGSGSADLAWEYCGHLAIWLTSANGGFVGLDLGPYPTDRNWISVPQPSSTPSVSAAEPIECPAG